MSGRLFSGTDIQNETVRAFWFPSQLETDPQEDVITTRFYTKPTEWPIGGSLLTPPRVAILRILGGSQQWFSKEDHQADIDTQTSDNSVAARVYSNLKAIGQEFKSIPNLWGAYEISPLDYRFKYETGLDFFTAVFPPQTDDNELLSGLDIPGIGCDALNIFLWANFGGGGFSANTGSGFDLLLGNSAFADPDNGGTTFWTQQFQKAHKIWIRYRTLICYMTDTVWKPEDYIPDFSSDDQWLQAVSQDPILQQYGFIVGPTITAANDTSFFADLIKQYFGFTQE